ncbi:hypothetical protein SAZ_00475 [Streptomyces noursei ZPM]|nr:hypothetical protein SAZ_00475 [Streptomyces noursei ZPM]EPY92147.1 hypothetical protein K530_54840 [Streptomyces noursei CCRC 11814]
MRRPPAVLLGLEMEPDAGVEGAAFLELVGVDDDEIDIHGGS